MNGVNRFKVATPLHQSWPSSDGTYRNDVYILGNLFALPPKIKMYSKYFDAENPSYSIGSISGNTKWNAGENEEK